jgi:hypothetical protein
MADRPARQRNFGTSSTGFDAGIWRIPPGRAGGETMTLLMLSVAAVLTSAAAMAGWVLNARLTGDGLAAWAVGKHGWRSANRGRLAARRRRHEAALATRLARRAMTPAAYHHAMSALAVEDESRYPITVPRMRAD